jgi:subtilisin family serine protease
MSRSIRLHKAAMMCVVVAGMVAIAGALADSPQGRPLMFDAVEAGPGEAGVAKKATLDKADDGEAGRAFYYSNGGRIYLNSTGLGVAKLKANADVAKVDLPARAAPAVGTPLGELTSRLERSGLVVVRTEGPQAMDLRKAADEPPADVEYVMPIVAADPGRVGLAPNATAPMIVTPRVAARFAPGMTDEQVRGYLDGVGLKISRKQEGVPDGYILELAGGRPNFTKVLKAANALYEKGQANGKVLYSHPDFIPAKIKYEAPPAGDETPTDPLFRRQWHLNNTGASKGKIGADVRAPGAWAKTTGKASVVVAIIDDSVEKGHPDLKSNYKAGRYYDGVTGAFSDDPSPRDGGQRHGTACAGVAVAAANSVGGRGVAPGCRLVGVNFWDGTVAQTAEGFYFAESQGASIISCSWSWGSAFDAVSVAIKDLARNGRGGKGTVILFAAGNDYGKIAAHQVFGTMKEVICVGASNWRDDHSKYSNTGPELSVVAPSSDFFDTPGALSILTTDNSEDMPKPNSDGQPFSGYEGGDYTPNKGRRGFGGTSSATPLAAGVCALILSQNPDLTAAQVRKILEDTADKIPGETVAASYVDGHDDHYGFGRVNAKRAVEAAAGGGSSGDLVLQQVEVTQGLQRDANDIPMVLGKPVVIRVYPKLAAGTGAVAGVSARLHALRGGTELPNSPIEPDNGPIAVKSSFSRLQPDDSLNFTLEPDWYALDTDFWAELVLPASASDPVAANNRYPLGAGTFPVRYQDRRGLSVRYVRIHYTNPNWGGDPRPRDHIGDQATCNYARSLFPIDPSEMPYDPWSPEEVDFGQGSTSGEINGTALITELNTLYAANPSPPDRLYGWTPELSFSSNGLSDPLWAGGQGRVVFGNDTEGPSPPSTTRYRRTFAHELGHNTDANGLFHTDRRLEADEIGYDVMGVDPFQRRVMRKYPPSDADPTFDLFDVMRGGELEPHAWITPPHYLHIFNALAPTTDTLADGPRPTAAPVASRAGGRIADSGPHADGPGHADRQEDRDAARPVADEPDRDADLLVVRGEVDRDDPNSADDGGGRFFPFYRIPATPENRRLAANLPQQGTHEVRFVDKQGQILKKIAWTPDFHDDDSHEPLRARPFTWFVSPIEGVATVLLLNRERAIATLNVLPRGPVVENLRQRDVPRPRAAVVDVDPDERAANKTLRLSWDASQPLAQGDQEDDLTHQIYYSNDNGKSWRLIASGLKEASADVDLSTLPGGDRARLQVRTSDGYNVTVKTSEPMTVADKSPMPEINAPRSGNTYRQGAGVLLVGRGYDREEGALADDRLHWQSDVQGELGTGRKLVVRDLRPGTHKITLYVQDSRGNRRTSPEVEVRVRGR